MFHLQKCIVTIDPFLFVRCHDHDIYFGMLKAWYVDGLPSWIVSSGALYTTGHRKKLISYVLLTSLRDTYLLLRYQYYLLSKTHFCIKETCHQLCFLRTKDQRRKHFGQTNTYNFSPIHNMHIRGRYCIFLKEILDFGDNVQFTVSDLKAAHA